MIYNKIRENIKKSSPLAFSLLNKNKKVYKFVISGIISTGTHLFFLVFFHQYLNIMVVLASSFAFIIAFFVSFSLQKYWTFRNYSQKKMLRQLFIYLIIAIISLNINAFFIHYLVNVLEFWYLFAQILVSLIVAFFNFFSYKLLVFKINK